jgi:hypothetical protein
VGWRYTLVDYESEIRSLKLSVAKQNIRIELLEEMILKAVQMRGVEPSVAPAPAASSPPTRLTQLRERYSNHGRPWSEGDRQVLRDSVRGAGDREYNELPGVLGRSSGAITSEVYRLRRRNMLTDADLHSVGANSYEDWLARQSK